MLPSFHIELEEVPYVNAYMQSKWSDVLLTSSLIMSCT